MKILKISGSLMLISMLLLSCNDIPSYPSDENVAGGGSIKCTVGDESVVIEPLSEEIPSDFIRGFDSSADSEGAVTYKNTAGNDCSLYKTLSDFGVNWVRLRVWNNPYSDKNPSVPGKSNKELVVSQAKTAKSAGLKVLLDFHYSDYWADPGKQLIPEAWLDASTSDQLALYVSAYTKEVLTAMKEAGCSPNMIQIGNEISSGLLKHKALDANESATNADDAVRGDFLSENYFKYLTAGIAAAREVCPSAKIMLHFTDVKRNSPRNYLASFSALDYDIAGLSWYSEWASHGSITELGELISGIKESFNKDVLIAETNVHHTTEAGILSSQYKTNLSDAEGNLYEGILSDADGNVIASIQNQANIIHSVIDVANKNGALGVFEWGGEYLGAWNSMFASSGQPLPSLAVYSVQ